MIPLPILQLFLYIFLYDFIGISLEIVGGMGYGVLGMVFIGGMGW